MNVASLLHKSIFFFSSKQVLCCFSTVYSFFFTLFFHQGSSIQNDGLLFFPLSSRQTCLMSSASLSDIASRSAQVVIQSSWLSELEQ